MAIRLVTPTIHLLIVLVAVGLAAESLRTEQKRDTWSALLATSLSGAEILQGKALGLVWRLRYYFIALVSIWSIGLLAGAIHPIGYLASLIGLATSSWFAIAIGLYVGLHTDDKVRQLLMIPYFLLLFSFVLIFVSFPWGRSIALGFGSMPFLTFLSLLSFEDVQTGLTTRQFEPLHIYGIATHAGFFLVLLTCLLGWIFQATMAIIFQRAAIRDFDKVAGRPIRAQPGESLATGP